MASSLEALATPSARFHRGDNRASRPAEPREQSHRNVARYRPLRIAIRRCWQNQSGEEMHPLRRADKLAQWRSRAFV
jgi:hypothetical protein